jgi:hypothetical protein
MEDREMKEYKSLMDIMDAIKAHEITDAQGAEILARQNASKGLVGNWSGHDGLATPVAKHPEADKEPADMVSGPSITARALAEEGRD